MAAAGTLAPRGHPCALRAASPESDGPEGPAADLRVDRRLGDPLRGDGPARRVLLSRRLAAVPGGGGGLAGRRLDLRWRHPGLAGGPADRRAAVRRPGRPAGPPARREVRPPDVRAPG